MVGHPLLPLVDRARCKVKAMLQANTDLPHVRLFIYLDSDAVVDKNNYNTC